MPQEYSLWQQPVFGDPPMLDTRFVGDALASPLSREPSVRVGQVQMVSGRIVTMVPFADDGAPLGSDAWRWSFAVDAVDEELWSELRRLHRTGKTATWVDFAVEPASWDGRAASTSYTLPRPPGSEVSGFPSADYPFRVWVAGSELTVVSGTPSAGEAQVTASTLELGTAPADGDAVELRYVPYYVVVVSEMPESLAALHEYGGSVVLVEAT